MVIQEKYEQVRNLINLGKDRGFLLLDEVNEILPAGEHTAEEIDDLFSTVERNGINIHQDITEAAARSRHHDTQGTERGIRAPL